jgi:hypothetical protein
MTTLDERRATASARTVLPTFKFRGSANARGRRPTQSIELEWGEPGVKMGQ